MMSYRPAAVAGLFYPANPEELSQTIQTFLQENNTTTTCNETSEKSLQALIAPHAGYVYSGPIAASAYSQLKQNKQERGYRFQYY